MGKSFSSQATENEQDSTVMQIPFATSSSASPNLSYPGGATAARTNYNSKRKSCSCFQTAPAGIWKKIDSAASS